MPAPEPPTDRLDSLLADWQLAYDAGAEPTPADLCPDDPPLAAALAERIAAFKRVKEALEGASSGDPSTDPPADRPTVIDGPPPALRLVRELGRGSFGVVYEAVQPRLNRTVAVKMMLAGREHTARFLAEAEAVAAVRHDHVVRVFEAGQADGRPYLAMEYLTGGSLADRLKAGPLPPAAAAELVGKLARGVHAAHEQGIVHRDLKPGNVLFDDRGEPKVTDFGLAKRDTADAHTDSFAAVGTLPYMSPEQARGESKFVDPRADVWALGAILYECLAGRRPFDGPNRPAVYDAIRSAEPPRPPGVPRDLELVCRKCLRKEAAERYPSAAALADDLAAWAAGKPVSARPVPAAVRAWKWVRRNPAWAGLAAALVAGTGVSAWQAVRASAEAERAKSAEGETRRQLAEAVYGQARLAMQRGQWEAALGSLDRLAAYEEADRDAVRLDKARVLLNMNRIARARAELERVPLAGGRRRLLEADILMGHDTPAALRLVEAALADPADLTPAEVRYARGLQARGLPEAAAHFAAALDAEPYHLRANQMLAMSRLVSGDRPAAVRQLDTARAYYPDDPSLNILEAFVAAFDGREAAADAAFVRAAGRLQVAQRKGLWTMLCVTARAYYPDDPSLNILEAFVAAFDGREAAADAAFVRAAGRLQVAQRKGLWTMLCVAKAFRNPEEAMTWSEIEWALKLGGAVARAMPAGVSAGGDDSDAALLVLPPAIDERLQAVLKPFLGRAAGEAVMALATDARAGGLLALLTECDLPDGMFDLIRGMEMAGRDPKGARAALARSIDTPSVFNHRRIALAYLAFCEWRMTDPAVDGHPRWRGEVIRHLTELYETGGATRVPNLTDQLMIAARQCGSPELGLRLAADHERRNPADTYARLLRAAAEGWVGNHAVAVERLEPLRDLNMSADHRGLFRTLYTRSVLALREQAAANAGRREFAPPPRAATR